MNRLVTSVLASVVFLLVQGNLRAEKKEDVKATSDTDFLVKATTCGVCEVKLSEYAAKHANDEKVRDFAERIAKEHKALNNTMAENARRLKVAVVAGQEKETRERLDTLEKLKGDELDREYLKMMIDSHEKAIKLFESESKSGEDADLRTVAKNNLPTLRKHLEEAQANATRLKK